jgi:hypothetical protein
MCKDEIVEEIRRIRQENAARFDYDIEAIVADARKRQQDGSHEVVSFAPRRPESVDKPSR